MSTRIDTPHFNLPFRLGAQGADVVEQDTLEDVANCVTAIVSTHIGWRDEVPDFGIPDLSMRKQPIGTSEINSMIASQEPRAVLIINERPGQSDDLIDLINIGVSTVQKKEGGE